MTNKLEILPCPFCGSEKCSPNYHSARVWVDCDSCGVRGQTVSSKWIEEERGPSIEEAIVLWNKRAAPVVERQEPVAYRIQAFSETGHLSRHALSWRSLAESMELHDFKEWIGNYRAEETPLYAEQPAPVAVLPERLPADNSPDQSPDYDEGWNACLDKVKELNQ